VLVLVICALILDEYVDISNYFLYSRDISGTSQGHLRDVPVYLRDISGMFPSILGISQGCSRVSQGYLRDVPVYLRDISGMFPSILGIPQGYLRDISGMFPSILGTSLVYLKRMI